MDRIKTTIDRKASTVITIQGLTILVQHYQLPIKQTHRTVFEPHPFTQEKSYSDLFVSSKWNIT